MRPGSRPPRLAILRFENLGADPSEDWIGRALAEILTTDLGRARDVTVIGAVRIHSMDAILGPRPVAAPGISAERQAAMAAGATELGYGSYVNAGGRLRARLVIEDAATRKVRVHTAAVAGGDALAASAALASQISRQSTTYGTRNLEVVRDYAEAMELPSLDQSGPRLQTAIAADPNFGPAYRMLAQLQLQHQDRAAAVATLEKAIAQGEGLGAVERARIAADLAGLENQPQLRLKALAALVKLDPNDPMAWQALAGLAMNRRAFAQAKEAYRGLVEREPQDFSAWNQLGYAAAYAGDIDTARDAMRHYAALRPTELNPLDSLGDVNLLCGQFKEAEQAYQRAAQKDPNYRNNGELYKAAMARLWTGDVAGATALVEKYHQVRAAAHDPQVELRRAEWVWLTGKRKEACARMEALARGSLNDVAPRAWTDLAIWEMMLGDRAAAQAASDASARSGGPNSGGAAVTRFLLRPDASGQEWAARAEQTFPGPRAAGVRNVALSAALLLNKHFEAAAVVLQQAFESGPPEPDATAPVLLAWSDLESGRADAAAPLLQVVPTPSLNGADALLSFSFPRFYYLRGELAAKQGRRDQALQDYRLFLTLSGPDPLMWGEEQKARTAAGGG